MWVKPMIAKIKAQKEQQIIDAEWDEPEEPIIENEKEDSRRSLKRKKCVSTQRESTCNKVLPFLLYPEVKFMNMYSYDGPVMEFDNCSCKSLDCFHTGSFRKESKVKPYLSV